ncbi:MAG: hypothetical protein Q4G05_03315 [Clostridia bacterium]|nr:hypothetical protein [Clostridia bacterium]
MLKNLIFLSFILLIGLFCLSGCYASKNIDSLAYIVALGIDVGERANLKISFQITLASNQSSEKSSGSTSQSTSTNTISIECDSIYSGVSLLNSYLSKKANFSHCKAIIFSEELATQGISKYVYTLINDIEIRTNSNVIICKNNCEYFIKNSQPLLEQLSAKYYESIQTSDSYTGFTENIQLKNFFLDLTYKYSSPYAVLGAVKTNNNNRCGF